MKVQAKTLGIIQHNDLTFIQRVRLCAVVLLL